MTMNIYNMYICFGGFRKKQQQSTTVWSMKHPYSFFVQHVHNNDGNDYCNNKRQQASNGIG